MSTDLGVSYAIEGHRDVQGMWPPPPYASPPPYYPYGPPPQQPAAPGVYGQPPPAGGPPPPGIGFGPPPGAAPYAAPPPAPYGAPPQPGQPPAPYGAPPPAYGAPPPGQQPPPAYGGPPPYTAPPPAHPPAAGAPMKKAVLIGCSYPGTSSRLNGCINDAQCLKYMLINRFGFQESNIVMLRDDVQHPDWYPTRNNIYRAIQWLMSNQQPGMSLFFSFSGHGSQKQDYSGDEDDGMDETILPTDYQRAGQIVDDELNALLVRPLMPGVTLHACIDACHSGTVMDLPFRTKFKGGPFYWKGRAVYGKGTAGGIAIQFGACRDSQVAQDTNAMAGGTYTGAATFSFIQAIERGGIHQSYAQVLAAMDASLRQATGGGGGISYGGGLLGMLLGAATGGSSGQTPVLSCSQQIDLNQRLML